MKQAQALVDAWVSTPFESGPGALDDLVVRIAAALSQRDLPLAIAVAPASVGELSEP